MFSQFDKRLAALEEQVSKLQEQNKTLEKENAELKENFYHLRGEVSHLREQHTQYDKLNPDFANSNHQYNNNVGIDKKINFGKFVSVLKNSPSSKNLNDYGNSIESFACPLLDFLTQNMASSKSYYLAVGDIPRNRFRNTLVPLGSFLGVKYFYRDGEVSHGSFTDYCIRFSLLENPESPFDILGSPFTSHFQPGLHMQCFGVLVYTETPQLEPLHFFDYLQLTSPGLFDNNGKLISGQHFAFGDGESQPGVTIMRPPGYISPLLMQSISGAGNFVAKREIIP